MSVSAKSCTRSNKRRINEIDDTIENLTHAVKNYSDLRSKSEFECLVMTAKLKREKIRALSAFSRSQRILAEMEILIAESDLSADLERLKINKKIEFKCSKVNTSTKTPSTSPHSSQATKRKGKSLSQPAPASKKTKMSSLLDTSTETVIIEPLKPVKENVPPKLSSKNTSDTDESLTNSLKAEFLKSYSGTSPNSGSPNTQNSRSPVPKDISQTQRRKGKSKTVTELKEVLQNIYIKQEPQTVSTYVARHDNMPIIVTRPTPRHYMCNGPSTSMGSSLYLNSSTNMAVFGQNSSWYGQQPPK